MGRLQGDPQPPTYLILRIDAGQFAQARRQVWESGAAFGGEIANGLRHIRIDLRMEQTG
jgi:hypothetical protein